MSDVASDLYRRKVFISEAIGELLASSRLSKNDCVHILVVKLLDMCLDQPDPAVAFEKLKAFISEGWAEHYEKGVEERKVRMS